MNMSQPNGNLQDPVVAAQLSGNLVRAVVVVDKIIYPYGLVLHVTVSPCLCMAYLVHLGEHGFLSSVRVADFTFHKWDLRF